jgi:hypothetical protein
MAASPLMDQAGLGAAVTSALRRMWRSYCCAATGAEPPEPQVAPPSDAKLPD